MANYKKGQREHLKKYQFKEGNAFGKGRPKGSRNLSTILKEYLEIEIIATDPLTGDEHTAPIRDILTSRLIRSALDGNHKAIRDIYDRLEGKPKQKIDVAADVKVKAFLNLCMQKAVKGAKPK